jgi:hypothetical protein
VKLTQKGDDKNDEETYNQEINDKVILSQELECEDETKSDNSNDKIMKNGTVKKLMIR